MKGFTKGTRLDISQLAKSEMERLSIDYLGLSKLSSVSVSHIKSAIHYNNVNIKANVYIKILSCLGIDILIVYSKDEVEFYYKKIKKQK